MGKVYLVGAGPGDSELITVKGMKCIQRADVILYDRLVNKELLNDAKENANLIYCGKLPYFHAMKQETINHFLVKHARLGKTVVRLKGGDPFVFGRGGEEAQALVEHNISFEVVPGITSGLGAPSYAGIPVTHRDFSSSFALVTGHKSGSKNQINWEHLAKGVDTLAIYMGVGNVSFISEQLIKYGRSANTPVAVIYMGTTSKQEILTATLQTISEDIYKKDLKNPSMIIVGEVVRLREKLKWLEQQPNNSIIGEDVHQVFV